MKRSRGPIRLFDLQNIFDVLKDGCERSEQPSVFYPMGVNVVNRKTRMRGEEQMKRKICCMEEADTDVILIRTVTEEEESRMRSRAARCGSSSNAVQCSSSSNASELLQEAVIRSLHKATQSGTNVVPFRFPTQSSAPFRSPARDIAASSRPTSCRDTHPADSNDAQPIDPNGAQPIDSPRPDTQPDNSGSVPSSSKSEENENGFRTE